MFPSRISHIFQDLLTGTGISLVYNKWEGLEEFLEAIYYCCCLFSSVLMGKSFVSPGMQTMLGWSWGWLDSGSGVHSVTSKPTEELAEVVIEASVTGSGTWKV